MLLPTFYGVVAQEDLIQVPSEISEDSESYFTFCASTFLFHRISFQYWVIKSVLYLCCTIIRWQIYPGIIHSPVSQKD